MLTIIQPYHLVEKHVTVLGQLDVPSTRHKPT